MKRCFALAALATFTALVGATAHPAAAQTTPPPPRFKITDLPLLPNVQSSHAVAINNAGQVVGVTITSKDKSYKAWVWTPAIGTAAAKIEALAAISSSLPRSYAVDINDAGYVAGKCGDGTSNSRATLWLPGQLSSPVDLNVAAARANLLPGSVLKESKALTNPDAYGVYLVVGRGDYKNPVTQTVTTNTSMVWKMQGRDMLSATLLQYPDASPADPRINAQDINNLGHVSGDYTPEVFVAPQYCCIWNGLDGSATKRLDSLGSQNNYLISDADTVIGHYSSTPGNAAAYISFAPNYSVDRLSTLLAGYDGQSQTIPYAINNRNQVVGQVSYASTGVRAACFWQLQVDATTGQPLRDANGTLLYYFYDLNKCSITGTSVVQSLGGAQGINDSGWITGNGAATGVSVRPYLLTPIK